MKTNFECCRAALLIAGIILSCLNVNAQMIILQTTSSNHNGYNISCNGGRDGEITITIIGGVAPYTIKWSDMLPVVGGGQIIARPNLPAGYIAVNITDALNNPASAYMTLTEPPPLNVSNTPSVYPPGNYNLSAWHSLDGSITTTAIGGITPYSYSWNDGVSTKDRTGLSALFYKVIVTDYNGCTASASITLTEPQRNDWRTDGNSGTDPSTQFIGTTDSSDFVFRTNNLARLKIKSNGTLNIPSFSGGSKKILLTDNLGNISAFSFDENAPPVTPNCNANLYNYVPFVWQTNTEPVELFDCWHRFGFGTVTPRDLIEVRSAIRLTSQDDNNYVRMLNDGGNSRIDHFGTGSLLLNYGDGIYNTGMKDVRICTGNSGNVFLGGNNYLAPDVGKNVGIGTTSPADGFKLDVVGNVKASQIEATDFLINGNSINLWKKVTGTNDLFYDQGNIGIGTQASAAKLYIKNNGPANVWIGNDVNEKSILWTLNNNASFGFGMKSTGSEHKGHIFKNVNHASGGEPIMTFDGEGFFGIGTTEPKEALQIGDLFTFHSGGSKVIGYNTYHDGVGKRMDTNKPSALIGFDDQGTISFKTAAAESGNPVITAWNNALIIKNNGHIGIGVEPDDDWRLRVCGKIKATEFEVSISWCDFVFDENYKRMSFEEQELFYRTHKRLPYIESGINIESNGLKIGQTMQGFVQNLEETRLDVIDLYKMIKELKEENKLLKAEIKSIKQQ